MSDLINKTLGLVKKAAELEELRMELSYEAIGGHGVAKPGGDDIEPVQHSKDEPGLFVANEDLLRYSKHVDYKMRWLSRKMHELEHEISLKLRIADEKRYEPFERS